MDILRRESQHNDHQHSDSFVLAILSHGKKGVVMGTDNNPVSIKDMTRVFDGIQCPSLVGKPKLIILQACQGRK